MTLKLPQKDQNLDPVIRHLKMAQVQSKTNKS